MRGGFGICLGKKDVLVGLSLGIRSFLFCTLLGVILLQPPFVLRQRCAGCDYLSIAFAQKIDIRIFLNNVFHTTLPLCFNND